MLPANPHILLIQTASIGDVILATALLESIKDRYPSARIDMLVKAEMQALFKDHPFLDEVMLWNKKKRKYPGLLKLLSKIRKKHYDAVVNIQRFASSGILCGLSGAPIRAGFNKNPFSFLFSHKLEHSIGDGTHEIDRNLKLISWIEGIERKKPRLYPGRDHEEKIKEFTLSPFITIAPASLWYTKQYPESQWVDLINELKEKYTVILLGGPADRELCERIKKSSENSNVTNLAGKLNMLESAALMKHARTNFVNDSAPLHMASAVDAPVRAIFCSTVPEFGFGPLSPDSEIIQSKQDLKCRPCGLHGFRECPEGHFKCAKTIHMNDLLLGL